MQPHDRRPVSPMLPAAVALSAMLHLVLLWPSPPVSSGRTLPAVRAQLTLREATAEPVPVVAGVAMAKAGLPPADRRVRAMPVSGMPVAGPSAEPGAVVESQSAPSESALRALRFALARGLVSSGAEIPAVSASLTLELRLLARRVVGLAIIRSSGSTEFDARVLAAFKAAAGNAVIPDSLPVEGFVVELELEGGEPEPSDDERPHASG